jgi:hypothetical protein
MKSRHIEILAGAHGVDLIVDDWEVFDCIDDLVTGCGLECEFTREEVRDGRRFYVMHFGPSVSESQVATALDAISAEEVERLWKLNN